MINDLNQLNSGDRSKLKSALSLIAVLIGKADNNFDIKEVEAAKKIAHIRTYNSPDYLKEFYTEVESSFDQDLISLNATLPSDAQERAAEITSKLSELNSILESLNPKLGADLYKGFSRFAQEIAKSSGGFLGFMSINREESKWVHLPMITPIAVEEEE